MNDSPSALAVSHCAPPCAAHLGLVLEGGAMRGMFTCGVIDVLMQAGIVFHSIVGVSAGAAFGCNYKSHQPGRALRYNQRFARNRRYCSLHSLFTTGNLFNAEFAYHTVPMRYDPFDAATFDADPTQFHLVATDVESGHAVYHRLQRFDDVALEWIRASCSMPLVSKVVTIDGYRLLDGGIADSIPLQYLEGQGCHRNIVVLTQPRTYTKRPLSLQPLLRLLLRRRPRLWAAMQQRHVMYNAQLEYVRARETAGAVLVISPDRPLPIRHVCHDAAQMQLVYDMGRRKAERMLGDIRQFVGGQ